MHFKLGDKVTTKSKGNNYYEQYKIGTVVEIVTHLSLTSTDGSPWCYVAWDKSTEDTYVHKFNGTIYRHVYGFYASSLELVQSAKVKADDPALPADPRLRGIAIKIRDIETRFKNRHNTYEYNNKERVLSDFQRSKVCTG
jgi:hypothetical protein